MFCNRFQVPILNLIYLFNFKRRKNGLTAKGEQNIIDDNSELSVVIRTSDIIKNITIISNSKLK